MNIPDNIAPGSKKCIENIHKLYAELTKDFETFNEIRNLKENENIRDRLIQSQKLNNILEKFDKIYDNIILLNDELKSQLTNMLGVDTIFNNITINSDSYNEQDKVIINHILTRIKEINGKINISKEFGVNKKKINSIIDNNNNNNIKKIIANFGENIENFADYLSFQAKTGKIDERIIGEFNGIEFTIYPVLNPTKEDIVKIYKDLLMYKTK